MILPQEGSSLHNFQNHFFPIISPVPENSKYSNPAIFPKASTLEAIKDPYWYKDDSLDETEQENTMQTLPDNILYPKCNIRH